MNRVGTNERPATMKLVLAFAAIYIIWGSTYLGILYAIETLPPLLMAGSRFIIAGGVLYLWARMNGATRPDFQGWRKASVIGALLLLGGNGMVVLAERTVPSGLAALLIATEPLMIVMLDWLRPGGSRPIGKVVIGLVLGFSGMALLVGPSGLAGSSAVDPVGAGMLVLASLSWATGSLYAARSRIQTDPVMGAAMQMLAGGALLLAAGLIRGEAAGFAIAAVSLKSLAAFLYLIVFGSLVGFTSYSWLLRVTRPAVASTYAYVNPIVAVMLGWAFAGEVITANTIIAAAIIIGSVVMISANTKEGEPEKNLSDGSERKKETLASVQDLRGAQCRAGD